MPTYDQLAQQVRFGLEQLSARNAHHEFENLCRYYARARICSNILPATGPVSAGGDQARDFETFQKYVAPTENMAHSFIGKVASQRIAFACTLQKQSLKLKIKRYFQNLAWLGCSGVSWRN